MLKRFVIITIISFINLLSYSQPRWVNEVTIGDNIFSHNIIEQYDGGYQVLGWYGSSYPTYSWIYKADRNGMHLWQKTIGANLASCSLFGIDNCKNGNIFISGSSTAFDLYGDPLVIKLNPCGDELWCRIFNTPGNTDYSRYILSSNDGGCIVLLNNTGPDSNYFSERIALAKLTGSGELNWYCTYLNSGDSMQNETIFNVLITSDSGFLLTGFCDYEDPNIPGRFVQKPYYIKTDSLGNFQWETVVHKTLPNIGGCAWSTTINTDSTFFYSSISHYYQSPSSSCPALLKMDFEGNVIDIYDVVSGFDEGKLSYASFINDSTLAASAGWGNSDDELWSRAVIIDTLGNLLNSTILMEDLYTSILEVTYDGKLVYMSNTFQDGQFDVYLTKLNQNLEQDTFYTMPFVYDSLCPYPILSDTIVPDDCGLIVNIDEILPAAYRRLPTISFYPNPASEEINLQFTVYNMLFAKENRLEIFDVFGRKMLSRAIPRNQDRLRIDISAFPAGLYIAIVKSGNSPVMRGKFVVSR